MKQLTPEQEWEDVDELRTELLKGRAPGSMTGDYLASMASRLLALRTTESELAQAVAKIEELHKEVAKLEARLYKP